MPTFISDRSNEARDYDIDANFLINKLCNFTCKYCFYRDDNEHPAVKDLSALQIIKFFNESGLRWHLHISGGEPFMRREFVEICQGLTQKHIISVNSNLTSAKIKKFSTKVRPEAVDVINAAIHIKERERLDKTGAFLTNFKLLDDAGFRIRALYVLTPDCFSRYLADRSFFADFGIHLEPKYFSGLLNGKFYPRSYTQEQKELFSEWSLESERILKSLGTRPRFDRMIKSHQFERWSLHGSPSYDDDLCSAGRLFASISEDGSIYRCGHKNKIGDIRENRLDLYEKDAPCDNKACSYFCYAFSDASAAGKAMEFKFDRITPTKFIKSIIPISTKNSIRRVVGKIF